MSWSAAAEPAELLPSLPSAADAGTGPASRRVLRSCPGGVADSKAAAPQAPLPHSKPCAGKVKWVSQLAFLRRARGDGSKLD